MYNYGWFALLWAYLAAQVVKNLHAIQETGLNPWAGEMPWRREGLPTPVFLPGEVHGRRSLAGYSPGVANSRT